MGAGGRSISNGTTPMKKEKSDTNNNQPIFKRVPTEKPPFTLSDIKKAVPPHLFKRSIPRSFSYVISDLAQAFILYYLAANYMELLPKQLQYVAWPAYCFLQGCVVAALWILGHECGHHAFSDYEWLDDIVGYIIHTSLLAPYSWKFSHQHHHGNTNSIEKDEVFRPKPKEELQWFSKYFNNPVGRFFTMFVTLALGLPLYFMFHLSGSKYDRFANHYDPYSPIYTERERIYVVASDVGLLAVYYGLYKVAMAKGVAWLIGIYILPVLIGQGFIAQMTYIQHTHPSLPAYDPTEWNWLRGCLSTVDRSYGILNKVFHDLPNTHVAHHLFTHMPHYNAVEVTKAIKPVLGEYYLYDDTPMLKATWREFKECIYVEADEGAKNKGVLWYRNKF